MKKSLFIVIGILVLLPLLLVLMTLIFIDPIVRMGVEKGGSAALKVPVVLKDASIRFSGRATLSGLQIANPPGYAEPRSVAFERVDAAVQPGSLLHDVVDIGEVTIVKPELTLEFSGTRSNWSVLMDNLSSGKSRSGEDKQAAPGKKFIIHKLRIEAAGARFRSDLIPGGAKSVVLPSIEVENVGTAEGGATLAEVLDVVLHQLGNAALKSGQGIVPAALLNDLGSTLKEGVKALEKLPSQSGEDLRKQKEKVEKGVKDFIQRP